jgi:hypothetical protein
MLSQLDIGAGQLPLNLSQPVALAVRFLGGITSDGWRARVERQAQLVALGLESQYTRFDVFRQSVNSTKAWRARK